MKKVGLFFITLVIMFFAFCGIYTKATATLSMETGASIRTEGVSGLRFKATLSELSEDIIEHGFYVALGNHSFDDMKDAIEAGEELVGENKLVKAIAPGENLEFAVTIYGMDDAEKYGSQITAIAYAKTESGFVFDTSYTRNIADIARSDYNTRENVGEYITSVANATRVKVTSSNSSVAYYAGLNEVTLADGDVVELIKGTYADNFTINANNVTIKGNNFGINGDGERLAESEFTNGITVNGNNVVIDGIKISGTSKMLNSTTDISNLTLRNIYSTATGTVLGGGRTAIIGSDNDINGLTLNGVKILCNASKGRSGLVVYGSVTNLDVQNCNFSNGATDYSLSEAIRINKISGTVNIQNNNFTWSTSNFSVFLGSSSNTATGIVYKNNVISGSETSRSAALALYRLPSGINVEIVHNTFDYMDATAEYQAIALANSSTANVFIGYNNFGSNVAYNCSNNGNAHVIHKQNYYAAAQSVATSDYGIIKNIADLEEKYEKYLTPEVAGEIVFELNGGEFESEVPSEYNLYSQLVFPTPTYEGYNFLGWTLEAESDNYITSLPISQTGNVTIYAHWLEVPGENFNISAADIAVLNEITPDIIVNSEFEVKKYTLVGSGLNSSYETNYYRYGINAFNTISDAVAAANANDVIYVFAGTYPNALTISTKVTLISSNYNVSAKDTHVRSNRTIISGSITITANGTIINGFDCSNDGSIAVGADNVQLICLAISTSTTRKCNGNNRQALIVDYSAADNAANYISNLTVKGCYLCVEGSPTDHTKEFMAFSKIDGLTIENNYITNTAISGTTGEGMMIYYARGNFRIVNNEFRYYQKNWLFEIGYNKTDCSSMLLQDNIFAGRDSYVTCSVGILKCTNETVIDIIGNQFINVEPSTITLGTASGTATCTVRYNYYDNQQQYKFPYATINTTCDYNYYGSTNASGNAYGGKGNEEHEFGSLDSMRAAYVDYLIGLIEEVEHTDVSYNLIMHARNIYNELTSAQKDLVTLYDTLTTAESTYASLAG